MQKTVPKYELVNWNNSLQVRKPPHLQKTCWKIRLTRELSLPRTDATEPKDCEGNEAPGNNASTSNLFLIFLFCT